MEILQEGQFLLAVVGVVLSAVTVIIGVASLIGVFVIPRMIREMARQEFEGARKDLSKEMYAVAIQKTAVVQAGVYFNYAVLAARVGRWAFGEGSMQQSAFTDDAIAFTESALALYAQNDPTHENIPIAKNNLAFYLSLRKRPGDGPRARNLGAEVLEDFKKTGNLERLNTYASIVGAFPDLYPKQEKRSVVDQLNERIIHNPNASDWDRRNATNHRDVLTRILERDP